MCGIVGIVAKHSGGFWNWVPDFFEEMLYADALRGLDSTGAFMVTRKNAVKVVKQAADPGMLFRTLSWKNFKGSIYSDAMVLVGHNRKATVGNVIAENAHPFVDKSIALVHNGYIANHRQLDSKVDVDSQSIITAIKSEEDYKNGLAKLTGAWAISWYDHDKKRLYLTRNQERPLYIIHTDNALFFASEHSMLYWLLGRHKIAHQEAIECKPGVVYEINWKNYRMDSYEIPRPVQTPVIQRPYENEVLEGDMCGLDMTSFRDDTFVGPADDEFELEPSHPLDRSGEKPGINFGMGHGDVSDNIVKRWYKQYPQGSVVLFQAEGFTAVDDRCTVKGVCWKPGHEVVPAIHVTEKKDRELWLNQRVPLHAKVCNIQRRDTHMAMVVDNLHRAPAPLKDCMGQELGGLEWKWICDHVGCSKCARPIAKSAIDFTTIGRKSGEYDVVCEDCNFKKTKSSTIALPAEYTDKPSVNDDDVNRARAVGAQIAAEAVLAAKLDPRNPPEEAGENGG